MDISSLSNIVILLGIFLTIILIVNGLLDMPVKIRNLWEMWKR